MLRSTALYWALRLCGWVLRVLPLRVSYTLARPAGMAAFYLWRGGRRRCIRNMLHVAAGDASLARRHARRSFAYYAAYLVDFLRFGALTPEELARRIDFDDWSLLERARTGNGIVFVTLHFGNWDLGAARIAERGIPLSVVVDTFGSRRLDELVVGSRERLGMHIIPAERLGTGLLRALRRNDVVALLIDVPQPETGVEVEFFGGTVAVPDGPARLALRTGAPIVTGLLPRLAPGSDRFSGVMERVAFVPGGDRDRDVRELTQATMRSLERMLRRDPEQWYIFRTLWLEDRESGEAA